MDLNNYLKEKRKSVDAFLEKYISEKTANMDCPENLARAMGYALTAGGKRVRPILAIASYEAAGGKSPAGNIIPVASSIELIHTYSLIHDDLPAMDNDDIRRNKPTTHKAFGEAEAILAGDALLTEAFRIISGVDAEPAALLKVINELAYGSGPEGMVGGQSMDILLEGKKASKEQLLYIHTHKTAALIRASIRTGAIMAGASTETLDALTEYGEKTGLAFQVTDDILDVTCTKEEMGKPTGSDDAKGKNTYPSIFGLEESRKIAEQLVTDSLRALECFDKKTGPLEEIAKYILARRN